MNAREVLIRKHLDENQPINVTVDCALWASAMQSTSYAQVRRAGFQDDFLVRLLGAVQRAPSVRRERALHPKSHEHKK